MLFFELFPAFLAVVAIAAGLGLFLTDRRARQATAAEREAGPLDGNG